MEGKAKRGLILFGLILFTIWAVWQLNFSLRAKTEHVQNPTLEDSIRKGKQRAKMKQDSARKADSVYTISEGDLKRTKNEINNNTGAIAYKRDSLRAALKAKAYADSIRYANRK